MVVARSKGPLEQLRSQYPQQVQVLAGDLADLSLGQKAADLATSSWNRIDSLIVNHGVLEPVKRISEVNAEDWRSAFDINVFSAVALVSWCHGRDTPYVLTETTGQSSTTIIAVRRRQDNIHFIWRLCRRIFNMGKLRRLQGCSQPSSDDACSRGTERDVDQYPAGSRRH